MKNLSRRSFVKTAVAAAALSGIAATAAGCTNSGNAGTGAASAADIELKPETEQLVCALLGKDLKIACVIIAAQEGLYQEEGLEVSFETVANLSDAITAISENKLDVLPFGVIPTCTFVSQGADLTVIGGTIAEGSECVVSDDGSYNASKGSAHDKTLRFVFNRLVDTDSIETLVINGVQLSK